MSCCRQCINELQIYPHSSLAHSKDTLMKMSTKFKMLERAFFLFEQGLFVIAHQEKNGVATQYTKCHAGGSFIFVRICMLPRGWELYFYTHIHVYVCICMPLTRHKIESSFPHVFSLKIYIRACPQTLYLGFRRSCAPTTERRRLKATGRCRCTRR